MMPNSHLDISCSVAEQTARVVLDGELDYETNASLQTAVESVLGARPGLRALSLDCVNLQFCDTIGISGLLEIRRTAEEAGVRLSLDNRSVALNRILEITGLLPHLTSTPMVGSRAARGRSTAS
jgi:anti-anti-sigma factor